MYTLKPINFFIVLARLPFIYDYIVKKMLHNWMLLLLKRD